MTTGDKNPRLGDPIDRSVLLIAVFGCTLPLRICCRYGQIKGPLTRNCLKEFSC